MMARETYLANGMLSRSPYASYKYSLQTDTQAGVSHNNKDKEQALKG